MSTPGEETKARAEALTEESARRCERCGGVRPSGCDCEDPRVVGYAPSSQDAAQVPSCASCIRARLTAERELVEMRADRDAARAELASVREMYGAAEREWDRLIAERDAARAERDDERKRVSYMLAEKLDAQRERDEARRELDFARQHETRFIHMHKRAVDAETRAATAEAQAEAMRPALEKSVEALGDLVNAYPFSDYYQLALEQVRAALLAATSPGKGENDHG